MKHVLMLLLSALLASCATNAKDCDADFAAITDKTATFTNTTTQVEIKAALGAPTVVVPVEVLQYQVYIGGSYCGHVDIVTTAPSACGGSGQAACPSFDQWVYSGSGVTKAY